jgi:hypothetical protein
MSDSPWKLPGDPPPIRTECVIEYWWRDQPVHDFAIWVQALNKWRVYSRMSHQDTYIPRDDIVRYMILPE